MNDGLKGSPDPTIKASRGRKTRKLVGVLIVLVVAAIFYGITYRNKSSHTYVSPPRTSSQTELAQSATFIDSDGDGLKDWEEVVYQTDPQNPDSDGDGIPDGEEILSESESAGDSTDIRSASEKTQNIVVSRELLKKSIRGEVNLTDVLTSELLQTQGAFSLFDADSAPQLFAQLQTYADQLGNLQPFLKENISDETLIIQNTADTQSIKNYFNEVANIYQKYISPLQKNGAADELAILDRALSEENSKTLAELIPLINAIKEIEKEVVALPAPKTILTFHKKELWYLRQTIEQLVLLAGARLDDPFYIFVISSMRLELRNAMITFHGTEIPRWLKEQGITFSPNEAAHLIYSLS